MEDEAEKILQKVAELLRNLAILKNQERTQEQIVAMARYLGKHFTYKEISSAAEYNLQRSPYFPNISDFFTILKPEKTLDQRAIELRADLIETFRETHFNYALFNREAKKEHIEFVRLVGWDKAQTIFEKDAIEVYRGIINTKDFYLGGISENKKIEQ